MKKERIILLFALFLVVAGIFFVIAEENVTNSTDTNSTDSVNVSINNTDSVNLTTNNTDGESENLTSNNTINSTIDPTTNTTTNSSETNLTGNWSRDCSFVNNRVQGRIRMYEEMRDPHLNRFQNIVNQVNRISEQAILKGYNTTQLDLDMIKLNESITKFHDDYAVFILSLKETRNFTCGHSEGEFKNALNVSKEQLRIVRDDIENIKAFIKDVIKKDIAELRRVRIENRIKENLNKSKEMLENRSRIINQTISEKMERLNQTLEKRKQDIEMRQEQIKERMDKFADSIPKKK